MQTIIISIFNNPNYLWGMAILFARFYGVFFISPLFAQSYFNHLMKILLAWMLAFFTFPSVYLDMDINMSIFMLLLLLMKEICIGAIIGYLLSIPLWVIETCGGIIDIQRGEQFGATVNQLTKNPSSSLGKLLLQTFITYFISINGLIFMLNLVFNSFLIYKPFDALPQNILFHQDRIIDFFAAYFQYAIIFTLPVIFCILLLDLGLGLISSFVPQMNITVMSMGLKTTVALIILIVYINILFNNVYMRFVLNLKYIFSV